MDFEEYLRALVLRGPNHGRVTLTPEDLKSVRNLELNITYDGQLYTLELTRVLPPPSPNAAAGLPGLPSGE